MVYKKTNGRKALTLENNSRLVRILAYLSVFIAVEAIMLTMLTVNKKLLDDSTVSDNRLTLINEPYAPPKEETDDDQQTTKLPDRIDFQPVIDSWANNVGGVKSVLVYDLERSELSGEYNSDAYYYSASLYKLFVVYEGYRKTQSGEWKPSSSCGSTGHTILECLDLSIRESNSRCAETLWAMIGRGKLDEILKSQFDITNSNVSHFSTTPEDILKIMTRFYYHDEIYDEELVSTMTDSFLNQPVTEYNWRQGLPSGFSKAYVYNKVGWDYDSEEKRWNVYHDAAIVEFPEHNRHFVMVVMSKQIPFQNIRQLGSEIEDYYYNQ